MAAELVAKGHRVSATKVGRLLHELGYSLQVVRKTREGMQSSDRNAQFEHIDRTARAFMKRGQPVVSVDTKKKELIGDFKNGGHEWQPKGQPEGVRVHDFIDKELGKVIPYGVYDTARNEAWVSVRSIMTRPICRRDPRALVARDGQKSVSHGDAIARDR